MPFFAPLDWGAVAARVPQPRGEAAVSPGALLAARVAGGGGRLGGGVGGEGGDAAGMPAMPVLRRVGGGRPDEEAIVGWNYFAPA